MQQVCDRFPAEQVLQQLCDEVTCGVICEVKDTRLIEMKESK
jgi:hypothetical protein